MLTVISIALTVIGVLMAGGNFFGQASNIGLALIAYAVAAIIYAIAWIVAFLDSFQEKRWGWLVALIILLPFWIGPLLYAVFGPKNTK
jgi:ABC-type spermidine/putrescine transport system permease subunit I